MMHDNNVDAADDNDDVDDDDDERVDCRVGRSIIKCREA